MKNNKNIIIAIAGGTGCGKSTFANKIVNALKDKSVSLISTDNYYKDYSYLNFKERKNINYDHPNAIDIPLLVSVLKKLLNNQPIYEYIYNFSKNIRTKEKKIVKSSKVIIVEGILVLAIKEIRELADIKLFIKTDDDIRIIRRIIRDVKERNRTLESIIDKYLAIIKPMHELFVEPSTKYADIIIPYYEGNSVAFNLILSKIKSII